MPYDRLNPLLYTLSKFLEWLVLKHLNNLNDLFFVAIFMCLVVLQRFLTEWRQSVVFLLANYGSRCTSRFHPWTASLSSLYQRYPFAQIYMYPPFRWNVIDDDLGLDAERLNLLNITDWTELCLTENKWKL